MLLTEADQVPHDQEVPGKAEFCDELEFVTYLCFRFFKQVLFGWIAVAFAHAVVHTLGQEAVHRLALGHRIMRKLVAEIVERKVEPLAYDLRIGNGFGNVAEERRHLATWSQYPLGVRSQQTCGF